MAPEQERMLVPLARRQGAESSGRAAQARRHVSTGVSGSRSTGDIRVARNHRSPGSAPARDRLHPRARERQEGRPGRAADTRKTVGSLPAGGFELPRDPGADAETEADRCPATEGRLRCHEAGRSPDQERRGALRRDAADWTWVAGWSRDHTGASPDDPRRDQAVTPDDLLGDERAAAGRCLAAREQPASRREVAEGGGPAPAGYDV